jgi:hypothetical protein
MKKLIKITAIFAIACCCVLLLPQARNLIIEIGEKILRRGLNHDLWMKRMLIYSLCAISFFSIFLVFPILPTLIKYIQFVFEKYGKIIFVLASIGIVLMSILVRTVGTFFLFFISFSLTWLFVLQKIKDWRSSFITAFICFGVFVCFLTEILGGGGELIPFAILCGWIGYNVVLLIFLVRLYKKNKIQIKMPQIFPFQWEYGVLALILFVTFFIALAYPPNNWDSMTYHLPRIEHWLQNKSLNHYYTSNDRQLFSAPFAEILILQGRALSGDDYLANLVQWFCFLGSIMGISKIAGHLGMNKKMQIISALFFAAVPMAILQASSTQTDLVATFCIICLTERLFAWRKTGALFESISFGIALGLSILTKGTAYFIAFPFVLYFAVICIKHFRKRFIGGCLAAILCLAINFPHYTRNYLAFNNPLEAHSNTVSNFTIKSFVVTFFADINSNLVFPFHRTRVDKLLERILDALEVDNTIFPYGRPSIQGIENLITFHEDLVKNFLHMILIIITFVLFLYGKKRNMYIFLVIGSWCMFAYCIPWQPWITRLQLPLFALSAPVFSLVFEDKNKFRKLSMFLLISYAILPLVLNSSRPLLPISGVTSEKTVWNTPRDELVFINRQYLDTSYTYACAAVVQAKIQNLGIIIGYDSWEYPLWRYIRKNPDNKIRITHVREDTLDDNIEALFILDRRTPAVIPDGDNINTNNPLVLTRNLQNKAEWENMFLLYKLRENIKFAKNKSIYQTIGWSFPEEWGTWTDGEKAGLTMIVDGADDLFLHLNISYIFYNAPIDVYVNNVLAGGYEFVIGDNVIPISKEIRQDKQLKIQFEFKDPKSPEETGHSGDTRKLGIGVSSFYIDTQ